ncbi:MAG: preprotein translocase subunit SecE [Pseudomonadota bacterium]|nr:preprotein translocase subunit SecE [Pseudomonadota bacterium]
MLFIIGGILAGVFARSLVLAVMGYAALQDTLLGGLVPVSTLIGIVVAITALAVLLRTERARSFTDSVVTELQRVTWPTREETLGNTGIVVGATIFFATLLSAYDFLWAKLTGIFLYTTG